MNDVQFTDSTPKLYLKLTQYTRGGQRGTTLYPKGLVSIADALNTLCIKELSPTAYSLIGNLCTGDWKKQPAFCYEGDGFTIEAKRLDPLGPSGQVGLPFVVRIQYWADVSDERVFYGYNAKHVRNIAEQVLKSEGHVPFDISVLGIARS